jgi:hypothetical protein
VTVKTCIPQSRLSALRTFCQGKSRKRRSDSGALDRRRAAPS